MSRAGNPARISAAKRTAVGCYSVAWRAQVRSSTRASRWPQPSSGNLDPPIYTPHCRRGTLVATLIGSLPREVNAGPTYGTTDVAGIAQRQAVLETSRLPAVAELVDRPPSLAETAEFLGSTQQSSGCEQLRSDRSAGG